LPLSKEEKKLIVQELIEELGRSSSIVLSDYQGLDVKSITQLRNNLREQYIKFKIYKNTLIRIAAKDVGLDDLIDSLSGCTAIAFAKDESFLPLKLLHKFSLDNKEQFKLKVALLEGKIFSGEQLERIACLPSRDELLANIIGNMKSSTNSFVFALKSPLFELVNVLEQIHKNKSGKTL
jgi:large subunit ribosomal protein L10